EPYDFYAGLARMPYELLQLRDRHTELRMSAGSAHMMMVAAANTSVDAHENLTITENIRPCGDHIRVVHSDANTTLKRPNVLLARREIRCIQNPLRLDVREQFKRSCHLATRHALEFNTLGANRLQNLRVRIRLHCVVNAGNRGQST